MPPETAPQPTSVAAGGGWRPRVAAGLFAIAIALVIAACAAALVGGGVWRPFGVPLSFTSWKTLRAPLLLLAVAAALHPRRTELWARAEGWVDAHRRPLLAGGWVALFAYLAWFKVAQHLSFHTGAYDFSMFHHAVHNTVHGRFLYAYGIERNFFSEHFSPMLLALVPLYALWESPHVLLVTQALAVALAAIPAYLIFRHHAASRLLALLGVLAFVFNAYVCRAFAFDFHIELFLAAPLFAAVLFGLRGRVALFHLFVLLALTVKEDVALAIPSVAFLLWLGDRRRWPHWLAAVGVAGVWAVLAWKVAIPRSYPTAHAVSHFVERYSHLGSSYGEIALHLLTSPKLVLGRIFSRPIFDLLASLGFVPLLDPWALLLSLPPLLVHLVSGYEFQARLGVYYGLFGALILYLALPRTMQRAQRWKGPLAAAAVAFFALVIEPRAPYPTPPTGRDRVIAAALESVPSAPPVSAQTTLIPHLPPAQPIALYPDGLERAEWVLVDAERMPWPQEPEAYRAGLEGLLSGGTFGVVEQVEGFLALRRGAPTTGNGAALEWLAQHPPKQAKQ